MTTNTFPPVGTVQDRSDVLQAAGSGTRRASVLRASGGGPIVGLAITSRKNPGAPGQLIISGQPRAAAEAKQMVNAGVALPLWLRAAAGKGWTYVGRWRPVRFDTGARAVKKARKSAPDRFVDEDPPPSGILYLEPEGEVLVNPKQMGAG